ncbi:hypothetical protein ACWA7J_04310 [Leptothrix sp. BB-4]
MDVRRCNAASQKVSCKKSRTKHIMPLLISDWGIDRELERLTDFVQLVKFGLSAAPGNLEIAAAMRDISTRRNNDPYETNWEEVVAEAQELTEKAKQFSRSDANYLNEILLIRCWSILEFGVEEILLDCLSRIEECKTFEKVRSLKGPLIDFVASSAEKRAELLLIELKTTIRPDGRLGVGAFEALLDCVGMGGGVDEITARLLLQLQQTRNVLVHRRGFVDRRFVEACPFLQRQIGDRLDTSNSACTRMILGLGLYDLELRRRNYLRANISVPIEVDLQRESIIDKLDR